MDKRLSFFYKIFSVNELESREFFGLLQCACLYPLCATVRLGGGGVVYLHFRLCGVAGYRGDRRRRADAGGAGRTRVALEGGWAGYYY